MKLRQVTDVLTGVLALAVIVLLALFFAGVAHAEQAESMEDMLEQGGRMIEWGWPQLVVASLFLLGVGLGVGLHGQPKDPWNGWTTLAATALHAWLLYMGGFWT